jgi:cation diffusion facilitator family transporter
MAGPESGTKATVAALAANTGIATAKFVAFAFTGSASMLAEGIHSVADTSNQALLLFGVRRSKRAATEEHPFGYGRERYFWSFMVAVVLFTVGSVFSIVEGYDKLRHPHEIESLRWAIGVLSVAVVLESFSLRTAVHEANAIRPAGADGRRIGWWTFIRRAKAPELPVLLLEDLGALIGLVFALTGITLAAITDEARFDAVGSLAIGVLLGVIAIVLAIELRSLLIGEGASEADLKTIEDAIASEEHVEDVFHVRTLHIGPDDLMVAAKVRLRADLHFSEVAEAINRIEARVRERVPAAKTIYIEPDVKGSNLWAED